ncbi:hypothetical protein Zmor_005334 [Zophobas morio]|uniref:Uncharacterized protein n=1 Tax=Zophobas morio TaxID=2755281 RepID=A0AA38MME3_9CUCU|nr:hypothetical protein Zmor_005334 [Zophobas morio]
MRYLFVVMMQQTTCTLLISGVSLKKVMKCFSMTKKGGADIAEDTSLGRRTVHTAICPRVTLHMMDELEDGNLHDYIH